jgi:hypothetical protein
VVPQPAALLTQILELLQSLVDKTNLVLLKVSFRHLLELLLEVDEEVVNALLKERAILLTLDENSETLHGVHHHHAAAYNVAKLLLGPQGVKARLVKHLGHQQEACTLRTILVLADHNDILNAVVDVVGVLECGLPAVIATRRKQYATLSRPLARWQTTRLQCALDKLCDVKSVLLVHVSVHKNLNVHLTKDLREEGTHIGRGDGFELIPQLELSPAALSHEPASVCGTLTEGLRVVKVAQAAQECLLDDFESILLNLEIAHAKQNLLEKD